MLYGDISAEDIRQAGERLAGKVVQTPIRTSPWLSSATGADIFLKLENLQITGSFKYRGALNCLSVLWAQEQQKVVTASAGNHALGIAEAARSTDMQATICVPRTIAGSKLGKLQRYGCTVIQEGDDSLAPELYARGLAAAHKDLRYVSPYNDPLVIAGQGTVALEILRVVPEVKTIVVAVGGGGLVSGVALAARNHNPNLRIVGVVAENSPVMKTCVEAGAIIEVGETPTIADTIAGNIEKDSITFPVAGDLVDDWVAVPEHLIRQAMFEFLTHERMLIEGSAAAAIACVSRKMVAFQPSEKVAVIVCGGNVATEIWHDVCREYLPHSS